MSQLSLGETQTPWPERMRPQLWDDFVGHDPIVNKLKALSRQGGRASLILAGPPGTGKSTLVRLYKQMVGGEWFEVNGAEFSTAFLKSMAKGGALGPRFLLIDEVHRLSKSQQDHLLEPLERGSFHLVATTTESPFHFLNKAVLSRVQVLQLESLNEQNLGRIFDRAFVQLFLTADLTKVFAEAVKDTVISQSGGDARRLISLLADTASLHQILGRRLTLADLRENFGRAKEIALSTSQYHDVLSAMIKSIRGSDPDAALLWMAYLIRGGIDPRQIARRLVISASEDIGNAEPRALGTAVNAAQAVELVGLPEVGIILSQAVIFLSCSPKSNSAEASYRLALAAVDENPIPNVPLHLTLGGRGSYESPHATARGFINQSYGPGTKLFREGASGFEKKMIEYWKWLRGEERN